jgi:hypothetical protein
MTIETTKNALLEKIVWTGDPDTDVFTFTHVRECLNDYKKWLNTIAEGDCSDEVHNYFKDKYDIYGADDDAEVMIKIFGDFAAFEKEYKYIFEDNVYKED